MNKKKKRSNASVANLQGPNSNWIKLVFNFILVCLTLTGGFSLIPRISVSIDQSSGLHDPFQVPFIIKNDGFLEIDKVDYNLILMHIKTANHITIDGPIAVAIHDIIPKLPANNASSVFIDRFNQGFKGIGDIESAEIYLQIKYQVWPIPFTWTKEFMFKTFKNNNNEFSWLPFSNDIKIPKGLYTMDPKF